MNNRRATIAALISLAVTPMTAAQVFKCDGPDGPIYSDRECGPGATNVELSETSGLGGISDKTKADLAEKKSERAQARNRSNYTTVNNKQNGALTTENSGRWVRGRNRLKDRIDSGVPVPDKQRTLRTGSKRRK